MANVFPYIIAYVSHYTSSLIYIIYGLSTNHNFLASDVIAAISVQCSRLNLSHFHFFLKMVMPNQRSQRLESIFLCTTQATPTGQ